MSEGTALYYVYGNYNIDVSRGVTHLLNIYFINIYIFTGVSTFQRIVLLVINSWEIVICY